MPNHIKAIAKVYPRKSKNPLSRPHHHVEKYPKTKATSSKRVKSILWTPAVRKALRKPTANAIDGRYFFFICASTKLPYNTTSAEVEKHRTN